jgi:L-rhamnose-H+ transport protein
MEANLLLGASFVFLAAACNGTLAVPQKFVKGFAWENTWGAFYLFTMVLIPAGFALLFLKGGPTTWQQAGIARVAIPIAFGFCWGCGMTCFGLGIDALGISLGYAIIMGLSVLVGSAVPLFSQHAAEVLTTAGLLAVLGIVTCTAGVAVCGRAGALREQSRSAPTASNRTGSFAKGLTICILAGVLGSSINLAFCYSGEIVRISEQEFGNSPAIATLTAWMLVFWGGFLSTGPYCAFLLTKNRTWKNFTNADAPFNIAMAATMGILHFLILFFYGIGAHYLGALGTSVGWAAFLSCGLVIANLAGFMTGEWRGASGLSRRWLLTGLAVLILGVCMLGAAHQMQVS